MATSDFTLLLNDVGSPSIRHRPYAVELNGRRPYFKNSRPGAEEVQQASSETGTKQERSVSIYGENGLGYID